MDYVARCMHRWAGVTLDASKTYLVQQRLNPLRREYDSPSIIELVRRADRYGESVLQSKIVDALTTHETKFFRDDSFIELMSKSVIPELTEQAKKGKQVHIWSAGCSTGQEACSLAMLIAEATTPDVLRRFKILGTDVSSLAVDQAKSSTYGQNELRRGLSDKRISTYFDHHDGRYQLKANLRSLLNFRVESLAGLTRESDLFDLILCRNVLIYFTEEDSRQIINQLARRMHEQSYLIVGSSELLSSQALVRQTISGAFVYRAPANVAS